MININLNYPYIGFKNESIRIPITFPKQHQDIQPGMEYKMEPVPIFDNPNYIPSDKLKIRLLLYLVVIAVLVEQLVFYLQKKVQISLYAILMNMKMQIIQKG